MANTLKFGNGNWAVKEGSTLAYNDENNNFKPLPFNFERDSKATVVNKDGLIETVGGGIPRIDFLGNTQGALKLEPQRTNLSPYSEDLNNFSTSNLNVTINPNQITSPSGNLADKVEENNVDGSHAIRRLSGISVTAAQDYAFSFFAKKDERSIVGISNTIGGAAKNAFIDIENGVILSSDFNDSSIDNYGNGWYKISLTDTATITSDYDIRIYTSTQDGDFSHQGVVGYGFYIWGISVEQGSYATSYIPTQGSAVTRLADVCNNGGNEQVINSTEGVLYFETRGFIDVIPTSRYIQLSKSGEAIFNNSLVLQHRNNGYLRVYVNGTATADIHFNINIDFTENHKIAVLYKLNGYKLFIDGVEQNLFGTPTQAVFSGLNDFSFDNRGINGWNGKIKEAKLYNTALTDAELQALTS